MRRPLAWVVGGLTVLRLVRRRRTIELQPADPRADELRERLAEARSVVDERDEFEAAETTVDQAEPGFPTVDERRREIHEAGRARLERMQDRS
jgi:hypothetical protein